MAVVCADGKIVSVTATTVEQSAPFVSAGFVDLQVNGFAGDDLNSGVPGAETLEKLARHLLRAGVTCFAPTLITASEASLCAALDSSTLR